jgi:thiosulfate reductase cytochrome b subunit
MKKTNTQNIDVIATQIEYIADDVKEIKEKLNKDFVTVDQFNPIQRLVYGIVSLVLVSVFGALISLVIMK